MLNNTSMDSLIIIQCLLNPKILFTHRKNKPLKKEEKRGKKTQKNK